MATSVARRRRSVGELSANASLRAVNQREGAVYASELSGPGAVKYKTSTRGVGETSRINNEGAVELSYIVAKGQAAADSALTDNSKKDYRDNLLQIKAEDPAVTVKLVDAEEFVEYQAANVFGAFYTTPVEKGNNAYEKLAQSLFDKGGEENVEAAKKLIPKSRFLVGFIRLNDGKPVVIDVTKNQAKKLVGAVRKYEKQSDKRAFELSKEGEGQSTTVELSPVLEMDDLTDQQQQNFNEAVAEGRGVNDDIYENALYMKNEQEQMKDLRAFADKFEVNLAEFGMNAEPDANDNEQDEETDYSDVF